MRKILGLIALALSFIASPLAAQTASSGQALQLDQTITGPATLTVEANGPRSDAAFPGGPATDADSAASVNQSTDLSAFGVGLSERLSTGVLETSAMASATQATGTATVNNLAFALGANTSALPTVTIGSLLNITATTVQSTSMATVSPLAVTGTTTITGLQLSGSVFTGGSLILSQAQVDALAAGTVAPNTVIFNEGGIKITLNRQVVTGAGTSTLAIATDAIAVEFLNAPVGTGFKNGELLIASSSASATAAVPISPQ